jgi:hypothetical protein
LILRAFDWRDLAVLHRYRHQGLCLDSALGVTRGHTLIPRILLSYLSPGVGISTWVCADQCDPQPLLGQIIHRQGSAVARISFLAPQEALESPSVASLLDQLAQQAGQSGAYHLLAEIDEDSPAFESLRRTGFAVYARQRLWRYRGAAPDQEVTHPWRRLSSQNAFAVQALYHNLVPGLVGQIESLANEPLEGLVYQNGEMLAYAELKYGPRGIWAQPFLHPDAEDVEMHLNNFLHSIPDRRSRDIYLCVRSYQSWLEPGLETLGAEAGPRQAVLVKRMAVPHKVTRPFALPKIEGQPEISAPIAHSRRQQN